MFQQYNCETEHEFITDEFSQTWTLKKFSVAPSKGQKWNSKTTLFSQTFENVENKALC